MLVRFAVHQPVPQWSSDALSVAFSDVDPAWL
jgi:hypothetical protein